MVLRLMNEKLLWKTNMKRTLFFTVNALIISLFFHGICVATTADQLNNLLQSGEKITIIDIRNRLAYRDSHIVGAISIPSDVIAQKRLPPLGHVIVYGDGVRTYITQKSVAALNSKRGIDAEMLEGGISYWNSLTFPVTRSSGLSRNEFNFIQYQEVDKIAKSTGTTLIDLRSNGIETVLTTKFLYVEVIKPEYFVNLKGLKEWNISSITRNTNRVALPKVNILIDDGDGESEKVANLLKSAKVGPVAILAGGKLALETNGISGVQKK